LRAFALLYDYVVGQESDVTTISLAEAKARLSELVERAAAGETVCITRRGKPIARLTSARPARQPVDVAALQALVAAAPPQAESAEIFVRRMRDEDRY
jgi:prevent-host-death family protein